MTRVQAYISLVAFIMMSAMISMNALYMQEVSFAPMPAHNKASNKVFQTNFKLTYAIQRELKSQGYGIEKLSGHLSLPTRGAIMAYQTDYKLPLTAEVSDSLLQHILFGGYGSITDKDLSAPNTKALKISVSVQQILLDMGYSAGPLGAINNPLYGKAILQFEKDFKLPTTGRMSGRLIKTLQRVADLKIKIQ